ncbi:unnamed protein product [Prorocentrum cordatum]|uniref:Uncharacterized protein n=1 Tax=Prorocentrum cordatum TaxID=2364126 RepID=A0ABN9YDV4_9DINO|nr:unnamed protein product [Polarella glacialis]
MEWGWLRYVGDNLFHQRWVSGRVALSASEYVGTTPDGDTYIEKYDENHNEDVDLVRWSARWNDVPNGVNPARVYRFREEPTAVEKHVVLRDAELLADHRCRVVAATIGRPDLLTAPGFRALVPGGPSGAAPAAAAAAAGPVAAAGPRPGVLQGVAPQAAAADAGTRWRAAQSLGDVRYGDEVPGHVATAAAVRGRDLHALGDGSALFVEEVPAAELEALMGRAVAADARVMPVMRTGARREATWSVMAARVREEDFGRDWLVTGPRATFWCIEFISNEGMGIDGHHDRFRAVAKLEPTQWGVQEHFQCAQYIRLLLLSDQCDRTNLQACEPIFRRMQTIEYSYQEKVREREGANQSGKLSIEEQTHFAGSTRISSSLMACPDLLEFVREEVEREAALAKNLRKVREEKELSRGARKMVKVEGAWGAPFVAPGCRATGGRLRMVNSSALLLAVMSLLVWLPAILFLCQCRRSPLSALPVVDFCRGDAVSGFSSVMLVTSTFGGRGGHLSLVQQRVTEHVRDSVGALGAPPAGVDSSEALRRLRAPGFYGSDEGVELGNYNPELLSLPSVGGHAVPLADFSGAGGRRRVAEFVRDCVLRAGPALERRKMRGARAPYSDPALRQTRVWSDFVSRLHRSGLLDFAYDRGRESVEFFCVPEQDQRLRLVCDCRRSNVWFREPDNVAPRAGETLGNLQVAEDETLYISEADLSNAFYHLQLPVELRDLFTLRRVRARDIGVTEIGGVPVHDGYVDNFVAISTVASKVNRLASAVVERFRGAGLVATADVDSPGKGLARDRTVLGWGISCRAAVLRPTRARVWRARQCARAVLRRGRVSGKVLEGLVGHMGFVSLVRRESLSVFDTLFAFIRRFYYEEAPLWPSVINQLAIWEVIAPLLWRNLKSSWGPSLYAVDASPTGLGVCSSPISVEEAHGLGRHCERWRFSRGARLPPRLQAAAAAAVSDDPEVQWLSGVRDNGSGGFWDVDGGPPPAGSAATVLGSGLGDARETVFREVPLELLRRDWKLVGRCKWNVEEPMSILEGRAILHALRHALRNVQNFGRRIAVLGDALVAACAVSKGRSDSRAMLKVAQSVAALCLATGCVLHCRWLPSEWNVADGPSRGLAVPSVPQPLSLSKPRELEWLRSGGQAPPAPRPRAATGGDADAGDAVDRPRVDWVGFEALGEEQSDAGAHRFEPVFVSGVSYGMTVCQTHSARPATSRLCQDDFASFTRWLKRQGRPMLEGEVDADQTLSQFLGEMYLDGARVSLGQRMLAAVLFHQSALSKTGGARVPRGRRALKGWQRLAPAGSRLGVPCEVMCMIVMWMWLRGLWEEGLVTWLTFEMCYRPDEPFTLRAQDLVPPAAGSRAGGSWSLTLRAREHGVASKTQEFDQAQLLDLDRQAALGPALAAMLEARFGAQWRRAVLKRPVGAAAAPPLFAISSTQAGQAFDRAVQALGLRRVDAVLERLTALLRAHALLCADLLADVADLTLGKNQSLLMGWLAGGLIIGFHVALPRQTYSRIRDRGGGPPLLRCLGGRRMCARAGERHQQLVGKCQGGMFWTKPRAFAGAPLCRGPCAIASRPAAASAAAAFGAPALTDEIGDAEKKLFADSRAFAEQAIDNVIVMGAQAGPKRLKAAVEARHEAICSSSGAVSATSQGGLERGAVVGVCNSSIMGGADAQKARSAFPAAPAFKAAAKKHRVPSHGPAAAAPSGDGIGAGAEMLLDMSCPFMKSLDWASDVYLGSFPGASATDALMAVDKAMVVGAAADGNELKAAAEARRRATGAVPDKLFSSWDPLAANAAATAFGEFKDVVEAAR